MDERDRDLDLDSQIIINQIRTKRTGNEICTKKVTSIIISYSKGIIEKSPQILGQEPLTVRGNTETGDNSSPQPPSYRVYSTSAILSFCGAAKTKLPGSKADTEYKQQC